MSEAMAGSMVQPDPPGLVYRNAPIKCEVPGDYAHELTVVTILLCLFASGVGSVVPIAFQRRPADSKFARHGFFASRFLGTGAIIGIALMYMLAPARDLLQQPCLRANLGDYDWAPTIMGLIVVVLVFVHLVLPKVTEFGRLALPKLTAFVRMGLAKLPTNANANDGDRPASVPEQPAPEQPATDVAPPTNASTVNPPAATGNVDPPVITGTVPPPANASSGNSLSSTQVNLSASMDLEGGWSNRPKGTPLTPDDLTRICFLVVLLSGALIRKMFTGLALGANGATLAIAGALLVVEILEGLALGSRLAVVPFTGPRTRRWVPYGLCALYACVTPVGTLIGLLTRSGDPTTRLLVSGIFSAVGAGMLLYVGVLEMLGREFLHGPCLRDVSLGKQLYAYGLIVVGFGMVAATAVARW
jgi:zinc transporter 1/2/3